MIGMTVKECYARIGSYEEAVGRLGSEERIRNYLGKFCRDDTLSALCRAVEQGEVQQAFLYAHNLKGLYLNLSMARAGRSASLLCEALRAGDPKGEAPALLEALKRDHGEVLSAVGALLRPSGKGGEGQV